MTMPATDYDVAGWDEEPNYEEEPIDLDPAEVDALDRANWHLREIARIRREKAQLTASFDAEIRRIKIRLDARTAILDREEAWHLRPVIGLHRALRAADPKRTSITLACGTLKSKGQQPKWLYGHERTPEEIATEYSEQRLPVEPWADETETFIAWAREHHPELIAPRKVTITVPDASVTPLLEALGAIDTVAAEGLDISDPAPAKNDVKQALVKRDEKNKPLVLGVDPETLEVPPGLLVKEQEPEFSVDTDVE